MKKKQNITNITSDQIVLPFVMMYNDPDKFQPQVKNMPLDEQKQVLDKMKAEREFYKKVLAEDYRVKNPGSYRYADAQARLTRLNDNGKYLAELIKTS